MVEWMDWIVSFNFVQSVVQSAAEPLMDLLIPLESSTSTISILCDKETVEDAQGEGGRVAELKAEKVSDESGPFDADSGPKSSAVRREDGARVEETIARQYPHPLPSQQSQVFTYPNHSLHAFRHCGTDIHHTDMVDFTLQF